MSTTSTSTEDIAAELARLGSATIGESGGRAADRRLRPAWSGAAVAAPAYPVGCTPGDNLAVHVAVTTAPRGSVLVVDVGRVADRGYWGEVLTTAAEAAGWPDWCSTAGCATSLLSRRTDSPCSPPRSPSPVPRKDKPGTVGAPVRVGGVRGGAGGLGRGGRRWCGLRARATRWRTCWPQVVSGNRRKRVSSRLSGAVRRRWTPRSRCLAGAPGRRRMTGDTMQP